MNNLFKLASLVILAVFICDLGACLSDKLINPELIVYKKKRKVELYSQGKIVKVFPIGLGLNPVPPKDRQGDYATPEGLYKVCGKIPESNYYMALILNYPNIEDASRGLKKGLITKKEHEAILKAIQDNKCPPFNTKLGGQIEIHGMGSRSDWTWGCIALDNPAIQELYKLLPNGTVVHIKP